MRGLLVCLLSLALGLGACVDLTELGDYDCPDGGSALDYQSFGKPFFDRWCNDCHSKGSSDRQGAPDDVNFDSRDQIAGQRERIFVRSAADNDSMPPGPDDPPRSEREKLAEWLACGAP